MEKDWKNCDTEICGRDVWVDLSECAKMGTYLCDVYAYQRVTSVEENCHNQVDRMTHSVNSSQHLSSASSVVTQWAHEQRGHSGRDGTYAWAQPPGLPLTKADLAMTTSEFPICHLQKSTLNPQYGIIPPGCSANYLVGG